MKKKFWSISFVVCFIPDLIYAVNNTESKTGYAEMLLKTVSYILAIVFIILLAFYGTKFVAKKSQKMLKSKYVQIIDSVNLGVNNRIILAKVSNFIYVIAINNNQTTLIDKIYVEEFLKNQNKDTFDKYLNDYMTKNSKEINNYDLQKKIKEFFKKVNHTNLNTGKEDKENEEDN